MSKRYTSLLYLCFLLFAILFFTLSFHSRLATDDYYTIASVNNNGIIHNTILTYQEWLGRFSAVFVNSILFQLFQANNILFTLIPLITFALLLFSVKYCSSKMIHFFSLSNSTIPIATWSISFTIMLFFSTIHIGESWFWYCSASTYWWSIAFFLTGLGSIYSNTNNISNYLLLIICFVYVGGASELYSLLFMIVLMIIYYPSSKYQKADTEQQKRFRNKLILSCLLLCISVFINITASGNEIKRSFYSAFDLPTFTNYFVRMNGKLFLWFIPMKLLYIIAFAGPFYFYGKQLKQQQVSIPFLNKRTFIRFSISSLLLIWIVFFVIAAVIMQSGEYRIWNIVSFILSSFCCYSACFTGYHFDHPFPEILFTKFGLLSGLILLVYQLIVQVPTTFLYADAHDNRTAQLLQLKDSIQHDTLIYLNPLPASGMLYSAEISKDTSHFTNKELRMAYQLKFHIAVEKP